MENDNISDEDLRRIDSLQHHFTDIWKDGEEVNPIPEGVKVTVFCSNGWPEEGYAIDVYSYELGLEALIAKKWILQTDLDNLLNQTNCMSDARTTPPSFDEMVGLIEKNFKDLLHSQKMFSPNEIERSWQRYKTLNHLYQDEAIHPSESAGVKRGESVEDTWQSFWKEIVCHPDGTINIEQVKKELSDFSYLLEQVPKVYCHVTGSKLSKVMYPAETVITVADEYFNKELEEAVKIELQDRKDDEIPKIPPMRPEDHEQVDINMAAGMPENEASFQSGYTAGHDAGYEKGKREGGGVGADPIKLLKWIAEYYNEEGEVLTIIDGKWCFTSDDYSEYEEIIEDKIMELYALQNPDESGAAAGDGKEDAVAFAEWLEENTEIIRDNPKITLYRYCDKNNQWGNYTLDDIYDEYKQNKQS